MYEGRGAALSPPDSNADDDGGSVRGGTIEEGGSSGAGGDSTDEGGGGSTAGEGGSSGRGPELLLSPAVDPGLLLPTEKWLPQKTSLPLSNPRWSLRRDFARECRII